MIQFFSKNFFAKFFPIRYFQKTSNAGDTTVVITGIALTITLGDVVVTTTSPPTPTPDTNVISKSGIASDFKYRNTGVKVEGEILLSDIGNVVVIVTCNWETDEEIIELLHIIFDLLDDSEALDVIDTDEEDIELILSLLEI